VVQSARPWPNRRVRGPIGASVVQSARPWPNRRVRGHLRKAKDAIIGENVHFYWLVIFVLAEIPKNTFLGGGVPPPAYRYIMILGVMLIGLPAGSLYPITWRPSSVSRARFVTAGAR
jgi:hypothetical protein